MAESTERQDQELVLSAIRSVMDKYSGCQSALSEFLKTCEGAGNGMFCNFSRKLIGRNACQNVLEKRTALRWFYVLSIKILSKLWKALFTELHFPAIKVVVMQSINRQVLNLVLLEYRSSGQDPARK